MREGFLRIGEVAAGVGVSADTIRYYERLGLLPRAARTAAGYRQYAASAVERVRLVRNALRFGFSLKEIGVFMQSRHNGTPPCHAVRSSAERILTDLDRQIRDLRASQKAVRAMLREWDRRLAATPAGRPAHLLETLREEALPETPRRALTTRRAHPRPSRPDAGGSRGRRP